MKFQVPDFGQQSFGDIVPVMPMFHKFKLVIGEPSVVCSFSRNYNPTHVQILKTEITESSVKEIFVSIACVKLPALKADALTNANVRNESFCQIISFNFNLICYVQEINVNHLVADECLCFMERKCRQNQNRSNRSK